jgi:hypothetical protein
MAVVFVKTPHGGVGVDVGIGVEAGVGVSVPAGVGVGVSVPADVAVGVAVPADVGVGVAEGVGIGVTPSGSSTAPISLRSPPAGGVIEASDVIGRWLLR